MNVSVLLEGDPGSVSSRAANSSAGSMTAVCQASHHGILLPGPELDLVLLLEIPLCQLKQNEQT